LVGFFDGCGNVYLNRGAIYFAVGKFEDIYNKIIPFFKKYPILGVKSQDLADFCRVAELMKEKRHLTGEGVEQIRNIKKGMNKGRGE
jgi:hypothetical protein